MDINSGAGTFGKAHLAGWIPSVTDDAPRFDPRTTSAAALQELLSSGKIKSVQILNEYYRQILAYNDYLKAVYQLAPGAITRAKELDALRASGNVLSPLHGIPVLLKDNIGTDPSFGMDNTGGNLALVGSFAAKNAPIVDRLIAAGAIILGKTTLSEMMWYKYCVCNIRVDAANMGSSEALESGVVGLLSTANRRIHTLKEGLICLTELVVTAAQEARHPGPQLQLLPAWLQWP